jgi:hypothetical protein
MIIWLAKKLLRITDSILEQAMIGRGRLALFIEINSESVSPYTRRAARELGVNLPKEG